MQLSERDAKRFIAALLGDAKPNAKLREVAKRYRKVVRLSGTSRWGGVR